MEQLKFYDDLLKQQKDELKINIQWEHPDDPDFDYYIEKEVIDFDKEKDNDILTGNGFIVADPSKSLKKDLKHEDGIFSTRFGQTLGDLNPYMNRYHCKCGRTTKRINHNTICEYCGSRVVFTDDNFGYFAWMVMKDPYVYIHPSYYKQIEKVLGYTKDKHSRLDNILNYEDQRSKDGHIIKRDKYTKDEPFYGIGMLEFRDRFDEIMDFYYKKNPKRKVYYDEIMSHKKQVFTHSIPVFTTLLRPVNIKDGTMYFEKSNAIYRLLNTHVARINNTKTKFSRNKKNKNQTLYKIQCKVIELYEEIEKIISGKKGNIRTLVGGRYSFSTRAVIVQNPMLRSDQIIFPYFALAIMLQQRIINILHRTYNISYSDSANIWYDGLLNPSVELQNIIRSIINSYNEGLPVMINRPPTIIYGSIMQMFVVDFTLSYTIQVPLRILDTMNADFDGDEFNAFLIINDAFFMEAFRVFNPRNAMYISRNDGNFNPSMCIRRDSIINANSFMHICRDNYTSEQLAKIEEIIEKRGF